MIYIYRERERRVFWFFLFFIALGAFCFPVLGYLVLICAFIPHKDWYYDAPSWFSCFLYDWSDPDINVCSLIPLKSWRFIDHFLWGKGSWEKCYFIKQHMYSHGQKMVNMFKKVWENESALLILLIFYIKKSQKSNLSLDNKKNGGKYYERRWTQLLAPLEILMSKISLKYIPIHIHSFEHLWALIMSMKLSSYVFLFHRKKKEKKTFPFSISSSFSPSLASLYLFEQCLRLGVRGTSSVCLPLQD